MTDKKKKVEKVEKKETLFKFDVGGKIVMAKNTKEAIEKVK